MENPDFSQNYRNYPYQNQMNQLNRISSPFKEYGINQSNVYINRDNLPPMQNNGYYNTNINNQFSYLTTPKKIIIYMIQIIYLVLLIQITKMK